MLAGVVRFNHSANQVTVHRRKEGEMSNSKRAKERRQHRSKLNKHQCGIMAKQHFGDANSCKRQDQADRDKSLAEKLGLIKQ